MIRPTFAKEIYRLQKLILENSFETADIAQTHSKQYLHNLVRRKSDDVPVDWKALNQWFLVLEQNRKAFKDWTDEMMKQYEHTIDKTKGLYPQP
jgi:hypothetical protein